MTNKRDPNGPIPGFEEEFYGSVGHEKRFHKTHFTMPQMPWKADDVFHQHKLRILGKVWVFSKMPRTGDTVYYLAVLPGETQYKGKSLRSIFRFTREYISGNGAEKRISAGDTPEVTQ